MFQLLSLCQTDCHTNCSVESKYFYEGNLLRADYEYYSYSKIQLRSLTQLLLVENDRKNTSIILQCGIDVEAAESLNEKWTFCSMIMHRVEG